MLETVEQDIVVPPFWLTLEIVISVSKQISAHRNCYVFVGPLLIRDLKYGSLTDTFRVVLKVLNE